MTGTRMQAQGTFKITGWDEGPYAEVDGAPKLTRTQTGIAYTGDLEGEGTGASVMCYPTETAATYAGFERVQGRLGGRSGSFVLEGRGTYEDGTATTTWTVVPGSGTGELAGLRGEGGMVAHHGDAEVPYRLEYWFE